MYKHDMHHACFKASSQYIQYKSNQNAQRNQIVKESNMIQPPPPTLLVEM